jgi:hypothetical protein
VATKRGLVPLPNRNWYHYQTRVGKVTSTEKHEIPKRNWQHYRFFYIVGFSIENDQLYNFGNVTKNGVFYILPNDFTYRGNAFGKNVWKN